MSAATIYSALTTDSAYAAKQLHAVPQAPSIVRETFILERCRGKVVLDIGASGKMHEAIVGAAKTCYGIDRPLWDEDEPFKMRDGVIGFDIDDTTGEPPLPQFDHVELVVCGEVLEHLANPGFFLQRLKRQYHCPVLITVPNAFADAGRKPLERGIENVNIDHVAWYSYRTLKTLLARYAYEIRELYWYKGRPRFAEGLIVVTE